MPTYDLVCQHATCRHAFKHKQSIQIPVLRTCPKCGFDTLEQDYSLKHVNINDGVPRTIGQQAEKNRKNMGEELHRMTAESMLGEEGVAKRDAPTPWWREEGTKPIDTAAIKDVTKYVLTGDAT